MKTTFSIVLVTAAACGSSSKAKPDAMLPEQAIVVAGDFTAGHPGILSSLAIDSLTVTQNVAPAGAVGDDSVIRHFGNELFIVNRADGNNITVLNADTLELVEQLSTGPGSNPQDVAQIGDQLWVPVFGGAGVAVLTRGSNTINHLDLSMDDPDGKPNCVSAAVSGSKLYVACELLDDSTFKPRGPGKIYIIDNASGGLIDNITMSSVNPFGVFQKLPNGDLVIPTVDFNTGMGGIEHVETGANPKTDGPMVTNTVLGGSVSRVEIEAPSTMWLAVSLPDFVHANLVNYDLESNAVVGSPLNPPAEVVTDVTACPSGALVIADSAMNASGLRVYKNGTEVTTSALAVGLDTKSANALVCY